MSFFEFFRKIHCRQPTKKEEIQFLPKSEFEKPIETEWVKEMQNVDRYRLPGPTFPDGSINWQCSCMAGGSLVAHRCGHYFRKLYICMKSDDQRDPAEKCPNEFVDWAACMQNMSEERREQMRKAMTQDLGISKN